MPPRRRQSAAETHGDDHANGRSVRNSPFSRTTAVLSALWEPSAWTSTRPHSAPRLPKRRGRGTNPPLTDLRQHNWPLPLPVAHHFADVDLSTPLVQPTPGRSSPFDRASFPFVAVAISDDTIIIAGAARTKRHHQQRAQNSHFAPPSLNP